MRRPLEAYQLELKIPDSMPWGAVDFKQIERVLTNLISNSIKYSQPGSQIQITAGVQDASWAWVQVSNQGPPVPAEYLEHIFDKFVRITDAERVPGTGLGLSICAGIIEAHGGRIWAENLPGRFAFNFTLPLTLDGRLPAQDQTGAGMKTGPKILVIDDEPQILRVLRTILSAKDFQVTTANRGEEGLALAAVNLPDLIILDLGLPDI